MKFDQNKHISNRNKVSPKDLEPYFGKYVAWSLDGKTIVASAKDESRLNSSLRKKAIPTDEVVISYVPRPNEVFWGGVFMASQEDPS